MGRKSSSKAARRSAAGKLPAGEGAPRPAVERPLSPPPPWWLLPLAWLAAIAGPGVAALYETGRLVEASIGAAAGIAAVGVAGSAFGAFAFFRRAAFPGLFGFLVNAAVALLYGVLAARFALGILR